MKKLIRYQTFFETTKIKKESSFFGFNPQTRFLIYIVLTLAPCDFFILRDIYSLNLNQSKSTDYQ